MPSEEMRQFLVRETGLTLKQDYFWAEHTHETHELLWNERGSSTALVGSKRWTLAAGVGIWIPAGVPHSGYTPKHTLLRTAHFQPTAETNIAHKPVTVEITPLLQLLLDRLSDRELSDSSRVITEAMVIDVLEPEEDEWSIQFPHSPVLGPMVGALLDNPGDRRTLTDWARELGVSGRTITRILRAETGHNFTEWVANVKMQRALEYLTQEWPQADIAAELGYASVSAFGAAFKRITGKSPGSFAKLH